MSAATGVNVDDKQNDSSSSSDDGVYQYLVVDSGPIIRLTGMSTLFHRAQSFYTVPAVLQEIRDSKAREHLQNLPFTLHTKDASPEAIQAVIHFAKQTGDYASLSSVDIQVLALQYDLEKQGCRGDIRHVRTTPKRTVGLGKIQSLAPAGAAVAAGEDPNAKDGDDRNRSADDESSSSSSSSDDEEEEEDDDDDGDDEVDEETYHENDTPLDEEKKMDIPKSWASLVNPSAAAASTNTTVPVTTVSTTGHAVWSVLSAATPPQPTLDVNCGGNDTVDEVVSGQFSDAEEDEDDDVLPTPGRSAAVSTTEVTDELALDFPSLQASLQVPYEGSDNEEEDVDDEDNKNNGSDNNNKKAVPVGGIITDEILEQRKMISLQPVSKSGKLYNSFRKYGDLVKPKPKTTLSTCTTSTKMESKLNADGTRTLSWSTSLHLQQQHQQQQPPPPSSSSRIMGGMNLGGQEAMVEDDGEGWITCKKDIQTMKSTGALDPCSRVAAAANPQSGSCENNKSKQEHAQLLPPMNCRAACTTTDFAMQNVILQMNLPLLSVDGVEVRKLKSWVQRCGACFKIYYDNDSSEKWTALPGGRRLFCGHCGSDMMQRITCSTNGKTGRVRLHFSKKRRQPNLRGTKFSLPKPGSGNRFKGKDLLLREDQLLMGGAWNQKVKMQSGAKKNAAVSMFGTDLASSVGCNVKSTRSSASSLSLTGNDIQVGFGRRNPNAAKGRERRGKKKKSSDKACGLRRY